MGLKISPAKLNVLDILHGNIIFNVSSSQATHIMQKKQPS